MPPINGAEWFQNRFANLGVAAVKPATSATHFQNREASPHAPAKRALTSTRQLQWAVRGDKAIILEEKVDRATTQEDRVMVDRATIQVDKEKVDKATILEEEADPEEDLDL